MKCHYDILEIPRDADEAAIKVAYKKMALRWHPDKNMDRVEEAKEQFQLVQQAYEVLCDRQERAWYDSHREQILRSDSTKTEADSNIFDVYPFFTSTCFRGYGDDDEGFYTVYRRVFENIAKEDLATVDIDDKDDFLSIPSFGDSNSVYEDTVHEFYSYWMAYNTRITYSWLDERIPKEIRDRRIFKLIDKENKKVRAKAKKERNEEVRNLVQFVRKRDRRVQANAKRLQERAEENRKKQEQISRELRSEQRRSNMAEEQAEWTKFDNVRQQLEEIERHLGSTSSSEDGDEDSVRDDDPFLCVVCNKLFKTQKAFENHERSKKHKENVTLLKDVLKKEDDSLSNGLEQQVDDLSSENDDHILPEPISKKNRRKSKQKVKSLYTGSDILAEASEILHNTSEFIDLSSENAETKNHTKSSKKKDKSSKVLSPVKDIQELDTQADPTLDKTIPDDESLTKESIQPAKIKKKRRKEKSDPQLGCSDVPTANSDSCLICVTCKNIFTSNNKLFAHLKKSGHAQPLA